MKFFHHEDIDKAKWDLLVHESTNPRIYMLSWYLDIASPGWKAVIWDHYQAGLPLYVKKFYLLNYVPVPLLSQQTGIIFKPGFIYQTAIKEFFKSGTFKTFFRFTVSFHSGIDLQEINLPKSSSFNPRKNYNLNLNSSYEDLFRNFNDNRKRNLKKATALGWTCIQSDKIEPAIEMYKINQGSRQKDLKHTFQLIENIYKECCNRKLSELYCCLSEKGDPLAWCFFARFEKRIYYLFGAMNEEGKKYSAMSLIFKTVIDKYANQDLILDFEGGNLDGIGSYFESYGATAETYYSFTRNLI